MRLILLIFALAVVSLQYVEAKSNFELSELQVLQHNKRGITDIWNSIKNSATNAWIAIKTIAKNTKDKINQWIGNLKDHARIIREKLEKRIKEIREKSKAALEKLIGTGQLVKKCFIKENEEVEQLLKQILSYVTSCISNSLNSLSRLDKQSLNLDLNDTRFTSDVENKMNKCVMEEDVEECLLKVKQDIYSAVEIIEEEVLTIRMESKGIVDDLLDAVVNCSVEGLIDASNVIAAESIQIINCVKDGQ
ncbi:hypothetical protein O0L34_g4228 [Tuta absoluta]|nr:hypothetical protein O0L34_g4228 [Tuta absoluta]